MAVIACAFSLDALFLGAAGGRPVEGAASLCVSWVADAGFWFVDGQAGSERQVQCGRSAGASAVHAVVMLVLLPVAGAGLGRPILRCRPSAYGLISRRRSRLPDMPGCGCTPDGS